MKIGFSIGRFELGTPEQQLLDRFLIGFPRNGVFQKRNFDIGIVDAVSPLFQKRIVDHRYKVTASLMGSDGVVVIGREIDLSLYPRAFVYGAATKKILESGRSVLAGTELSTALQIPKVKPTRARESLIVTPREPLTALDGLLPLLKNPKPVKTAQKLEGKAVWAGAERKEWSWGLFRAALSRTDSPQGNAIIDGRVEDLAQLGLVPGLAKNPQAWLLEHEDGLRTTILILEGVIGDTVAAVSDGRKIQSTQLFQAPSPIRDDFSRLAAVIHDFFTTGKAPWGRERMEVVASAAEAMNLR